LSDEPEIKTTLNIVCNEPVGGWCIHVEFATFTDKQKSLESVNEGISQKVKSCKKIGY